MNTGPVTRIVLASATLTPEGEVPISSDIALPFRWDKHYPQASGSARVRLVVPNTQSEEPHALYFRRIGNQARINVNGKLVRALGSLGDPAKNYARGPVLIQLDTALLGDAPNFKLDIQITTQPGRWGGIPAVVFGPLNLVEPMYQSRYHWRQTASLLILLGLSLMGILAFALWLRQREPLFGLFALIAAFGSVKVIDRVITTDPLPWPLWGTFVASTYALHVVAVILFSLAICGWKWRKLWPLLALATAIIVPATSVAFFWGMPRVWTITLAALILPSLFAWVSLARSAWVDRSREAWLLMIASSCVIVAGIRDLITVRVPASGIEKFSVMPIALFLLIVFMAWIIVERYSQAIQREKALNASLGERITAKEQELSASYRALDKQNREQATLEERQRIMRDIHDGVGAHLVGLLNLANSSSNENPQIATLSQLALDELRMAIDSLQPVDGDLNIVMATLRYRMLPRLEEAGLKIEWNLQDLPEHQNLTPNIILNTQRIILEAFANVVRHANATTVRVSVRSQPEDGTTLIVIEDDGVGIPQRESLGQGIDNMRSRAQSIGAKLSVEPAAIRGTRVALLLAASDA